MRHIFIILFGSISVALQAQSAEDLFAQANSQYNLGQFEEALRLYDSIVAKGMHSADLYFNKGNTHYKLNQIAPSILNYEKALLLDKNHKGTLTNLRFAQNMTLDTIEPLPKSEISIFFERLISVFTTRGWAYVSLVSMFLACVFFGGYYMARFSTRKRIFFAGALLSFFICATSIFLAYHQQSQQQLEIEAVIYAQQLDFRSEPNLRSEIIVQLHEGTKLAVIEQIEQWAHVRLANGSMGWVPMESIQKIVF